MTPQSYPIKAVSHHTTDDADEMVRMCKREGWLLVNTLVGREVLEGGAFSDCVYYVLIKPEPQS